MSNTYWQGFGEVNDPENSRKLSQDEFQEELPFEGFDDKGLIDAKAPRRDFLKYLGFSRIFYVQVIMVKIYTKLISYLAVS